MIIVRFLRVLFAPRRQAVNHHAGRSEPAEHASRLDADQLAAPSGAPVVSLLARQHPRAVRPGRQVKHAARRVVPLARAGYRARARRAARPRFVARRLRVVSDGEHAGPGIGRQSRQVRYARPRHSGAVEIRAADRCRDRIEHDHRWQVVQRPRPQPFEGGRRYRADGAIIGRCPQRQRVRDKRQRGQVRIGRRILAP